jgi:hypothetical protein
VRITATLVASIFVAMTAVVALPVLPTANAVPGDPMAGCETQVFASYCDGPIREDGSWKRCLLASSQYTPAGGYIPPVQNCFIVPAIDQIPMLPLGQPSHHID